jgi:hypothetical protein
MGIHWKPFCMAAGKQDTGDVRVALADPSAVSFDEGAVEGGAAAAAHGLRSPPLAAAAAPGGATKEREEAEAAHQRPLPASEAPQPVPGTPLLDYLTSAHSPLPGKRCEGVAGAGILSHHERRMSHGANAR